MSLLANHQLTLNGVAENFGISRPAISKHIKILVECGLVTIQKQGREHYCEVQPGMLNEVVDWLLQHQQTWEQRFERLDEYLAEVQKKEKNNGQ